uniref:Protein SirB1 N-terminal domain-containing protein n=1 Tax=Tetradesmus obliquus TaxID=3088 RepID=A0A383V725_TETOB|eukprot:jgi/Sobl393_1/9219/SZX60951.1
MTQVGSEQGDGEELRRSFEDLPADFIHVLYSTLPLRDLVAASCICTQWLRCSKRVWESRVKARWMHGNNQLPPSSSSSSSSSRLSGPQGWKKLYRQRHERDAAVFKLLQDAAWPVKQEAAFAALMDMGDDAIDALAAAAHSSCASSMFLGVTFHAHVALHYVVGELSAVRLRQLLQCCLANAGPGSSSQAAAAAAAAAESAADPVPAAAGTAEGGGSGGDSSSEGQASAAASSRSEVEASLEGALLLAQALHPLSDVSAVRRLVAQLGQELARRMQQAHVLPGSRQAVDMLNKLMFGPPAPAPASDAPAAATAAASSSTPGPAATPAAAAAAGSSADAAAAAARAAALRAFDPRPAAYHDDDADDGLRFRWWRRNEELDGPDLSKLAVPQGSSGGMGLQGNSSSYYATSNSCLDSVLASRTGLPITLALLHAAVGEAAGLTVQLVGMPGHVINRALIKARGSQGLTSAGVNPSHAAGDAEAANNGSVNEQQQADAVRGGSGAGDAGAGEGEVDGSWMYIDVFNGGTELSEDDLRMLALRHNFPVDALQQLLQPMDAAATLRRMTLNLVNSVRMGCAAHVGRVDMQKPPLHTLQLRSISVALLSLQLAAAFGSSIPARDAFDMGVQLSHLIGLGQSAVGPPGGVLLMRKMAEVLPPALISWRVRIEAAIQGEVEAKERQQQQRQQQARLHSQHPSVIHRVGDTLHSWECADNGYLGTVLSWQAVPNGTPRRQVAALPPAAPQSELSKLSEIFKLSEISEELPKDWRDLPPTDTDEDVKYKILYDDGTIQDLDQPYDFKLRTYEKLLQHEAQQRPLYIAREEACAAQWKWQWQHLQSCWFEPGFVSGLRGGVQGSRQVERQLLLAGWPDNHLSHGQHFEAWMAPEASVRRASQGGDGWFWLNASLRMEFPEG